MDGIIRQEELGTTTMNLRRMADLLNRFSFTNLQYTDNVKDIVEANDAGWVLDAIWYNNIQRAEHHTIEWLLQVDTNTKSAVFRGYVDSKLVARQAFSRVECVDMAFTQHYNVITLPGEIA
jgi:hypothetical protein